MRAHLRRSRRAAAIAAVLLAASPAVAQQPATAGTASSTRDAEEPAPSGEGDQLDVGVVPPLGGMGMRLGVVGASTDRDAIDAELVAAGHAPLSSSHLGPLVGFHAQVLRLELGIEILATGDWSAEPSTDRPTFHQSAVLGTADLAALRLGPLSVGPAVGLGVSRSRLCVAGPARPRTSPGDTAFRQVLLDAGRESCLSTDTALLRPGLVAELTFWTDAGEGEPRVGFGVGVRGGALIPLGGDSRWTLDLEETRVEGLEGPAAPAGGWYLGLDLGIAFGIGRDD